VEDASIVLSFCRGSLRERRCDAIERDTDFVYPIDIRLKQL
jgi:hypothetical protein